MHETARTVLGFYKYKQNVCDILLSWLSLLNYYVITRPLISNECGNKKLIFIPSSLCTAICLGTWLGNGRYRLEIMIGIVYFDTLSTAQLQHILWIFVKLKFLLFLSATTYILRSRFDGYGRAPWSKYGRANSYM